LLSDSLEHQKMSLANNPYGDGTSAQKIVEILKRELVLSIDEINV